MSKQKQKPGPKPGRPKAYATYYLDRDLWEKKPDSKLVNRLLREHYERTN
jgi:hypothetical protein